MSVLRSVTITLGLASTVAFGLSGQGCATAGPETGPSLVERLGYDKDARLLIVHADDVGASHAINLASFDALASGLVTSASVMVPCAGLQEVADYAARHPEADLGLHLTLTSDDAHDHWGPVAPKSAVPSLVDSQGYFLAGPREALAQIDPEGGRDRAQGADPASEGTRPAAHAPGLPPTPALLPASVVRDLPESGARGRPAGPAGARPLLPHAGTHGRPRTRLRIAPWAE